MAITPSYGWVTPSPTDFVTDLPADFETFADAVDADLAGLLGGTTGQVLTKDSNADHDFSWTNAIGAYTSLATGNLTSTPISLTSISANYTDLRLVIRNYRPNDDVHINLTFNNDTSSYIFGKTVDSSSVNFTQTAIRISDENDNQAANEKGLIIVTIPDYANTTTYKVAISDAFTNDDVTPANMNYARYWGMWNKTAAVNRIDITPSGSTFISGTYTLYGVK